MDSSCVSAFLLVLLLNCANAAATPDPCESEPCINGICIPGDATIGEYKCECNEGYTFDGETCVANAHTDTDPCSSNPCGEGGDCRPLENGTYICHCHEPDFVLVEDMCVRAPCPNCYQGQCAVEPDMNAVAPGLMRTTADLKAEIPDECYMHETTEGDDYARAECRQLVGAEQRAIYTTDYRRWVWGDGNCCCPAHRYLWCPKRLYHGKYGWVDVIQRGDRYQCVSRAVCGIENGICRFRCVPVYASQVFWVCDPYRCYIIHYKYPISCRCTDCNGKPCKKGWWLGYATQTSSAASEITEAYPEQIEK